MDYEKEQSEIIRKIDTFSKKYCVPYRPKSWNKFKGDFVSRIIASYLQSHLPQNYRVAGPNVYIEGNPTEFDLMVTDSQAVPYSATSAFPRESIRRVIEIKTSGVYNIVKEVSKVRNDFDSALSSVEWDNAPQLMKAVIPKFKAAYLSISERVNPVHVSSIRFGDRTREILRPYPAFFLYDMGRKDIQKGEWRKFLDYIVSGL